MTVKQAVDMAKALRPRVPFPDDIFMTWVNEIEAEIHTEIFLLSVSDFVAHTDDTEQLYADPTHNKIYWLYLLCMIDLANGEMTRYQSDVEVYNGFMGEYKRWYAMEYHPADGRAELQGYYLSAYSLAVKHGFKGSEEEWLNFIQANGQAAQEAAARAEGAAQEATESAEAAEQSAQRAASFEESVARNAEAAEAAAEDALGAAASAALSATAAGDAAEAAEISAGNAQGSASAAQAAQAAAETAKALAETARAAAELASGNAEAARSAAETARAAAEAARDTSVSSAGAAQASALAAEAAKTASEAARNAAQAAQSAAAASAAAALVSEGKAAISATDAEAWAVGQRNGVDVGTGDPTWHNNAKWYKDQAEEIVGGDFATKTEAQGYANVARDAAITAASADATAKANGALGSAKIYTDTAIAAIPVPDVSGQIATHNASGTAHGDIRGLVTAEATARAAADGALQTAVNGKADKKVPAAAGNLAALDATGGLVDTGKQPGDFAPTVHNHTKSQITDFPASMTPTAHKATHAKGGTDELGAEIIGVPDPTASLYGLPDPTVNDLLGVLSGAAMVKKDVAQIGWFGETWQSTSPPLSQSRYMAYGKGLFVAIQRGGACATSPDGITWTQSGSLGSLPDKYWQSLTYGNGLFVAVADTNKCATSPDGITWTQRAFPLSVGSRAITYGGGLFVAVGATGNAVATSPDGINWTQRTLPASGTWTSITFGDGLFVAVASSSSIAATSPDGITWTQRALPISSRWSSVVRGDGLFVAVSGDGASTAIAATSPDGINWTQRTLPASIQWSTVTYGDGLFFAAASNSGIAATSPDGINWTQRALPTSASPGWRAVAYGNGRLVACAEFVALGAVSLDEFKIDYAAADIPGNIIGGFTRIETGEYTGTGTFGAGNPTRIEVGFRPKLALIGRDAVGILPYSGYWSVGVLWIEGIEATTTAGVSSQARFTQGDTYLSIHSLENANAQLNTSGAKFVYAIVG